ncbi:MAG: MFS transporter [Bdellovibrionales bacterium]|nr:MFS transporter [Bdellovibrionales bacterium]
MSAVSSRFSAYEKLVIGILIFLQFTLALDFMVMAPLGAIIMPAFDIMPHEFSLLIASYAFAACVSSVFVSGYADRYERKRFLLFIYSGFLVGTFLCAFANTYPVLLAARTFTGLFGGVIASIVPTLTTDLFPAEKRGQVIGLTQVSFGIAQIMGLPVALACANRWGWHSPFVLVVAIGIAGTAVIATRFEPITAHLGLQKPESHFQSFAKLFRVPKNRWGFLGSFVVTLGAYLLMPFTSAYNVHNLNMSLADLPIFYAVTGLSIIVLFPLIGKLTDRIGRFPIFAAGAFFASAVVLFYTHTTEAGLARLCLTNIGVFSGFFAMIIPFQSLLTDLPSPESRGGFMAVGASIQQLGGGVSVFLSGLIVSKDAEGRLLHFPNLGTLLVCVVFASFLVCRQIALRAGEPSKP